MTVVFRKKLTLLFLLQECSEFKRLPVAVFPIAKMNHLARV